MGAFFSGTDLETLRTEGEDTNCFVSLIVDTKGTYVAAITRKGSCKKTITTVSSGSFGTGRKRMEMSRSMSSLASPTTRRRTAIQRRPSSGGSSATRMTPRRGRRSIFSSSRCGDDSKGKCENVQLSNIQYPVSIIQYAVCNIQRWRKDIEYWLLDIGYLHIEQKTFAH